jgi:hypothetical protein
MFSTSHLPGRRPQPALPELRGYWRLRVVVLGIIVIFVVILVIHGIDIYPVLASAAGLGALVDSVLPAQPATAILAAEVACDGTTREAG